MKTCTTMTYTDGRNRTFTVMRGMMKGKAFDAHSAEIIARHSDVAPKNLGYVASLQEHQDVARNLTAKYATKEAPPVYWQK